MRLFLYPAVLSAPAAERTFAMRTYNPKETGSRIRALRIGRNLTQAEVAAVIGLEPKSFSKIERGITGCSIDTLVLLSDYFQVTLDYLVFGNNQKLSNIKDRLNDLVDQIAIIRDSLDSP